MRGTTPEEMDPRMRSDVAKWVEVIEKAGLQKQRGKLRPDREATTQDGLKASMASIIDIHPHVICPDTTRYPLAPLGGTQSTWSRDRPTSFETMIKEMDAAGVARSAIVQASTAYGHDNSYVAAAIGAFPPRLTG